MTTFALPTLTDGGSPVSTLVHAITLPIGYVYDPVDIDPVTGAASATVTDPISQVSTVAPTSTLTAAATTATGVAAGATAALAQAPLLQLFLALLVLWFFFGRSR